MLTLKLAALVEAATFLAALSDEINVGLNLFGILLIVLAAIPVARSRRKDQTIKDLGEALEAKTRLVDELHEAQRQLEQGCHHLKTEAAEWQARYEEQAKYTAEAAVAHFESVMDEHRQQVAERHGALLAMGAETTRCLEQLVERLDRIEPQQ